jgi:hypothetical protein
MKLNRRNHNLLSIASDESPERLSVCTSAPHAEMARNSASDEPCEEA